MRLVGEFMLEIGCVREAQSLCLGTQIIDSWFGHNTMNKMRVRARAGDRHFRSRSRIFETSGGRWDIAVRVEAVTGKLRLNDLQLWQCIISNSNFDPELELGFRGTVKLFVDSWIIAIKGYVGSGAVRKPLEEYVLSRGDFKNFSKLQIRMISNVWVRWKFDTRALRYGNLLR